MVRKLIDVGRVPDPASSRAERLLGPAVHPATRSSFPSRTPAAAKPAAARPDLEQWVGQRGLLIVGVLALLAATGFFLKYAFDHRWIPPALRSAGAVLSGVGLGIWGDRLISRGIRRYGAAMIGGGGGLVYLGLWAAAGPYALVDRRAGVLLLATATVAVALLALRHEVEGLALWAVLGAYLAPVLLPPPVPNPEALLGYLEVIGLGLALLAFMMSWRRAFDLALGGYLVMAVAGAGAVLGRPLGVWFLASGTLLTLHVTSRRPWPEARLGVVVLSWVIFASHFPLSQASQGTIWLALAAPAAVSALLWWQHFQTDPFAARVHGVPGAMADAGLCVASPFVLSLLARAAAPTLLDPVPAALPAAIGVLHGGVGWVQRRAGFLMLGIALLATAIATQWSAWATVVAWTGLTLAALAAHRWAARPGARTAAPGPCGPDVHLVVRPRAGAAARRGTRVRGLVGPGARCVRRGHRDRRPLVAGAARRRRPAGAGRRGPLGAIRVRAPGRWVNRIAPLLRCQDRSCRRPRPQHLLAWLCRCARAARLPTGPQGRSLGGSRRGGRCRAEGRTLRPVDAKRSLPDRIVLDFGACHAGRGLRVQSSRRGVARERLTPMGYSFGSVIPCCAWYFPFLSA